MNANRELCGAILVSCFLLMACSHNEPEPQRSDVHLVGQRFDGSTSRASYWKNGVQSYLQDAGKSGFATGIILKNKEVYISGIDYTTEPFQSVVWKDLVLDRIIDDGTSANGKTYYCYLEYDGDDQYVIGTHSNWYFKVFKNGTILETLQGSPTDVLVASNQWYVVGSKRDLSDPNNPLEHAVLWEGNTVVPIEPPSEGVNSKATGVAILNSKKYVCGNLITPQKKEAFIWIDGVKLILPASAGSGYAGGIYLRGTDVYVFGYSSNTAKDEPHATYWKNGVEVVLENTKKSEIYKLQVSKSGDVYVVGYLGDDYKAALWINGKLDNKFNGNQIKMEEIFDMSLID